MLIMTSLLFPWQESRTVNTAAFWKWSVLSSGYSPWRLSLQSTMGAGVAGERWSSASLNGLWNLKLSANLFSVEQVSLLLMGNTSNINSQCFKCCITTWNKKPHYEVVYFRTLNTSASLHEQCEDKDTLFPVVLLLSTIHRTLITGGKRRADMIWCRPCFARTTGPVSSGDTALSWINPIYPLAHFVHLVNNTT